MEVSCEAAGQQCDSTYYIKSIRLTRENVFPETEEYDKGLYRLANRFHSVTKEKVIRTEILLNQGDSLDLQLMAESERNLRTLDFLGKAEIRIDTIGPDSVNVEVYTEDQWSLIPSYIIEAGGGLLWTWEGFMWV